jgi:hypothetical protein
MSSPARTNRVPPRHFPQEIRDVDADVQHDLNRPVMVVHGPEIFDAGEASWLIDCICPSRTIVAGVMARTAAEESCLNVEFQGEPPSSVIRKISGPVFLANHGKTAESGRVFGDIVASRLPHSGLVQVECSDRTVYVWDDGDRALAATLSHLTGFELKSGGSTRSGDTRERTIRGCIPGEPVYVNGIIIGRATAGTVVLRDRDGGGIEPVSGLLPKVHGIEKLGWRGTIDLSTAWCKSGSIRSAPPQHKEQPVQRGNVVVIDHCGHEIYQRVVQDCCGVLAIGDDTTAVCGHICAHRGIPVLGIVDGDRDTIVTESFAPGSVVVMTEGERDDDIGAEVALLAHNIPVVWDEWVDLVLRVLEPRVRVVVDTRVKSRAVR